MGTQREGSDIDLTLTGKDLDFKILSRIETEQVTPDSHPPPLELNWLA